MISWIMGRSENSRNRVYSHDGKGRVFTEAADPSKMTDPSLIIYNAMVEVNGTFVVSNGVQTDLVHSITNEIGWSMLEHGYKYEPDAPNFTPRITGLYNRFKDLVEMSIHRKSPFSDAVIASSFFYPDLEPGFGRCLTTYSGDGDPLPPFEGEPFLVIIPPDLSLEHLAECYRHSLSTENFVALAVKEIEPQTGVSEVFIINRFEKVATASSDT
jgi:IMP cyclohydrolase